MITDAAIAADIQFALASGEFTPAPGQVAGGGDRIFGISPMMRYVVALNPDLTRTDWVRIATAQGFNKHTATKQFAQSRAFDRDAYGYQIDKTGRQIHVDTRLPTV